MHVRTCALTRTQPDRWTRYSDRRPNWAHSRPGCSALLLLVTQPFLSMSITLCLCLSFSLSLPPSLHPSLPPSMPRCPSLSLFEIEGLPISQQISKSVCLSDCLCLSLSLFSFLHFSPSLPPSLSSSPSLARSHALAPFLSPYCSFSNLSAPHINLCSPKWNTHFSCWLICVSVFFRYIDISTNSDNHTQTLRSRRTCQMIFPLESLHFDIALPDLYFVEVTWSRPIGGRREHCRNEAAAWRRRFRRLGKMRGASPPTSLRGAFATPRDQGGRQRRVPAVKLFACMLVIFGAAL